MRTVLSFLITAVMAAPAAAGDAVDFSGGRWVDLTHAFSAETVYWPTAEGFHHEVVLEGITEKGYYYASYKFSASEHGGTHVDAPVHFARGRRTLDEIPVDGLIGQAVVIDARDEGRANRDYQVTVGDFLDWEKRHGRIPGGAIVLLSTGSSGYWPDRAAYMGTEERGEGAVAKLHFPGLHPEAAAWLVGYRNIKAIGLDTPSIDYGQSTLFESHRVLFEKSIPAFENVANLETLPGAGATVIALPMKIEGGSGGPLRIVAWVPGE